MPLKLPAVLEHTRSLLAPAKSAPKQPTHGWASILWHEPLILATWNSIGFPLGILSMDGALRNRKCHVLLFPSYSLEMGDRSKNVTRSVTQHLTANPLHEITVMASCPSEVDVMAKAGCKTVVINSNAFVNEHAFRPLPEVTPDHDAVYNARLHSLKRHELATEIDSLALLFFRDQTTPTAADFHANYARYRQMLPNATFVNPLTPDGCVHLRHHDVNHIYARSRVGLCLSPAEGHMRVAMEYNLAGLPLVSTASIGGRDYFFDSEYCLVVEDDAHAVADAVNTLVKRDLPREYVRKKSLDLVMKERRRLAALLDPLIFGDSTVVSSLSRIQEIVKNDAIQPWCNFSNLLKEIG